MPDCCNVARRAALRTGDRVEYELRVVCRSIGNPQFTACSIGTPFEEDTCAESAAGIGACELAGEDRHLHGARFDAADESQVGIADASRIAVCLQKLGEVDFDDADATFPAPNFELSHSAACTCTVRLQVAADSTHHHARIVERERADSKQISRSAIPDRAKTEPCRVCGTRKHKVFRSPELDRAPRIAQHITESSPCVVRQDRELIAGGEIYSALPAGQHENCSGIDLDAGNGSVKMARSDKQVVDPVPRHIDRPVSKSSKSSTERDSTETQVIGSIVAETLRNGPDGRCIPRAE